MMFLKIFGPPLTVFLLSTIGVMRPLATADPAVEQGDQPFWQYVLREFVFKTISEPLPDDTLYTRIRDAPFYGGPLPEASDKDEDALLSRGSVFRVANEQWILCQDGCEKCESCAQQSTPMVRWALRRVKRRSSEGPPKWDFQLTVLPQLDRILPSDRTSGTRSYTERQNAGSSSQVSSATDGGPLREGFRRRNVDWANGKFDSRADGPDSRARDQERRQDHWRRVRSRNDAVTKGRQTDGPVGPAVPTVFQYSQEDQSRVNSMTDKFRNDGNSRLIVGIDQYGEKHLVHVVPMYRSAEHEGRYGYPSGYRGPYRTIHTPRRISRTIHPGWNEAAYDKLINRILDSLDTHRSIIETFLFSDRLMPETSKELARSSYPFYPGAVKGDERLQDPEARYSDAAFHRGNLYPSSSWYQVDKQDQQYRGYADTAREVNRPTVVYQDQSSEFEPYGMSPKDEPHDERSREDAERRRRDSRAKLTHSSTVSGRQGIEENRTYVDNTDSAFDLRRKPTDISANHNMARPRLSINHTAAVKVGMR